MPLSIHGIWNRVVFWWGNKAQKSYEKWRAHHKNSDKGWALSGRATTPLSFLSEEVVKQLVITSSGQHNEHTTVNTPSTGEQVHARRFVCGIKVRVWDHCDLARHRVRHYRYAYAAIVVVATHTYVCAVTLTAHWGYFAPRVGCVFDAELETIFIA